MKTTAALAAVSAGSNGSLTSPGRWSSLFMKFSRGGDFPTFGGKPWLCQGNNQSSIPEFGGIGTMGVELVANRWQEFDAVCKVAGTWQVVEKLFARKIKTAGRLRCLPLDCL